MTFPCSDWSAGRVLIQLVSVDDQTNYKSQDQTGLKRYAILADEDDTNTITNTMSSSLTDSTVTFVT